MTPAEMEDAIRNLQVQVNRIEQFLPNLATRRELGAVRDALRREIQDVRRHAVVLNEATRSDIRLLAENMGRVEAATATRDGLNAVAGGVDELRAAVAGLERAISGQISRLGNQIAALGDRLDR